MMTDKIEIAKGEFSGNLKDMVQHYKINFLPRVVEDGKVKYTEKLEIALITPGKDGESSYHSLRMCSSGQLRMFILDCIKGLAFFHNQEGVLNGFTQLSIPSQLNKQVIEIFKDELKGDIV